jgi:flagellar hook-basal body protein
MADPLSIAKSALIAGNAVSEVQATNMTASKAIAGRGQQFMLMSNRGSGATISGNGGVSGTLLKNISESGTIEKDGNALHAALGRKSFFVTDRGFTRVGTWGFNKDSDCVNHLGHKIKCFRLNENGQRINPTTNLPLSGNFAQTDMVTPHKNDINMDATATNAVNLAYKLGEQGIAAGTVNSTPISIYDSLGGVNNLSLNFTRANVSAGHVTLTSSSLASINALTVDATGQNVAAKAIGDQLIATLGSSVSFVPGATGVGTVTIPAVPGTAETVYTITVPASFNGSVSPANDITITKSVGGATATTVASFNTITNDVTGAANLTGYATAAALGATYVPGTAGLGTITIGSSATNPAITYNISCSGVGTYAATITRTTSVEQTAGSATAWYLKVTPLGTTNIPRIMPPYTNDGVLVEFDSSGNVLRFNNTAPGTNGSATPPELKMLWANAADSSIKLDLSNLTNNGSETQVGHIDINGNTAGQFKSMEWDEDGNGIVIFTNNLQKKWFQIAQARFEAEDELRYDGDGTYTQTAGSGGVVYGYSGDGFFETITPEALERANISEIQTHVDMISNQRYYMAQISVFKTAREMAQALDNL